MNKFRSAIICDYKFKAFPDNMGQTAGAISRLRFERLRVILPRSSKGSLSSFIQSDDH